MKLNILCDDRSGIAQEVLTTILSSGWELNAMEMVSGKICVHLDAQKNQHVDIEKVFRNIQGVKNVIKVDLLPSELKSKHLNALLSKLPDPLIDINHDGEILVANTAAEIAFGIEKNQLIGRYIHKILAKPQHLFLPFEESSVEITCANKQYLMEVTPVYSHNKLSGAVIVLKSPQRLGQQISYIDSKKGENIESMIGSCQKMKLIQQQTIRFAQLDLPVLITGDTGTGKELLARALHESGARKKAPFLAINCATLDENLLESELFGYAAGAFTGSKQGGKPGLFELADKGTVFLDEIAEMSVYLQAKLLRFLQEYTFRRIGGNHEIKVNVRIVCATHKNLIQMLEKNEFREDLFYRLNVLNLQLPSLQERIEDIPELIEHFSINAAKQINIPRPSFSKDAIDFLKQAPWPGNIRELQNTIFRTFAMQDKEVISSNDLCFSPNRHFKTYANPSIGKITSLHDAIGNYEKILLQNMFIEYSSTRKLAHRLDVSNATISRKLNKYGIK